MPSRSISFCLMRKSDARSCPLGVRFMAMRISKVRDWPRWKQVVLGGVAPFILASACTSPPAQNVIEANRLMAEHSTPGTTSHTLRWIMDGAAQPASGLSKNTLAIYGWAGTNLSKLGANISGAIPSNTSAPDSHGQRTRLAGALSLRPVGQVPAPTSIPDFPTRINPDSTTARGHNQIAISISL